MPQSTCRICGSALPPRRVSLCSAECKRVSEKARSVARYQADRTARITQAREWKRDNPERARELARDYGMRHRADTRERERQYRAIHRERYSLHGRRWYRSNLERGRELGRLNAAARRARILANGCFDVSVKDLRRTLTRFDGRCAYCSGRLTEVHWDHIVAIKRGGSHGIGNLVPACPPCNQAKSSKTVMEWRLSRRA